MCAATRILLDGGTSQYAQWMEAAFKAHPLPTKASEDRHPCRTAAFFLSCASRPTDAFLPSTDPVAARPPVPLTVLHIALLLREDLDWIIPFLALGQCTGTLTESIIIGENFQYFIQRVESWGEHPLSPSRFEFPTIEFFGNQIVMRSKYALENLILLRGERGKPRR